MVEAMQASGGNKAHAAKSLGVSSRALYRLLEKHGLAPVAAHAPSEAEA